MDNSRDKKVIALDVDGVLLDFFATFDKAAEIILKRKVNPNKDEHKRDHYHLGKRVDTDDVMAEKILQFMLDSRMYQEIPALEGVKEAVEEIKKQNFKIVIITALPESAREMRLINLKNVLNLEPDEMHMVGMGKSKKDALELVNPDIFIDDRIDYLASVPTLYHTVWCDRKEAQKDKETLVDVHVHSLKEWVDNHMPRVVKKLNRFYLDNAPLQTELKLENFKSSRKSNFRL